MKNEYLEFKEMFDSKKILKEICGFLNTSGGTILVGYDDDGKLVGIEDAKKCEEALSNQLEKCIEPDCRVFARNYQIVTYKE